VRRGLVPLVGSRVVAVEVLRDRSVRHQAGGAAAFAAALMGQSVLEVARRGKFLWLPLGSPDDSADAGECGCVEFASVPRQALLAHLGMSGQLRLPISSPGTAGHSVADLAQLAAPADAANVSGVTPHDRPDQHPHLRVRVELETPTGVTQPLEFIDQRTFGYLAVVPLLPTPDGAPGGTGTRLPLLPDRVQHIGRDLLDPACNAADAARRLKTKKSAIKRLLLDQTIVSGIGNIYADEALWQAKIHPELPANTLTSQQLMDIIDAAKQVIGNSLQAGGTSFDSLYVDVAGNPGEYENSLVVYGRENLPCLRCGSAIIRRKFMNRSSFYCATCQVY